MRVWYCYVKGEEGGCLVAAPTRGRAKVLAVGEMMLDFWGGFLEVRTKVWPMEIESESSRALTEKESVGLGLRMMEEWEY